VASHRIRVVVNDTMQQGYVYFRSQPVGRNFAPEFRPDLTPKEMLRLGVFGGKYMTDCRGEFPASWFTRAKLCAARHVAAIRRDCERGDLECRRRQRQAVLHWAYDSRKL
jgi:hypothetical protein